MNIVKNILSHYYQYNLTRHYIT